ncbi:MAG: toll/interleukin-1 receptor domain-containing protein [Methylocystis sp.]|uniref:toll/interleukin-1 receptor domain-containing protein n=1 Tax=Methylocystis sp. TaxID=1911079 RepID=UPI003937B99B
MSRIFISHSSANNAEAIGVRDWMISQGWEDIFLDLDPERGLTAGQRWQEALKQAAERCELVIFLVSPAWAASKWCLAEFLLAKSLNKRIFAAIIEPTNFDAMPVEMTAEWQVVDLTDGERDYEISVVLPPGDKTATVRFARYGLNQLRSGLMRAGLDARYFEWPPKDDQDRSPYPGLRPLEPEDAGIFFGREAPTVLALDRLRGLWEAAPPRLLVIQGASGAGKSSFLRAGLIPRLKRDDTHFLPLPIIRPERAVISGATGLIRAIEEAFKGQGHPLNRAEIAEAINDGASKTFTLLARLTDKVRGPSLNDAASSIPPSLVLSIDQGEELFLAEGAEEARFFLVLLKELAITGAPNIIILFTIRSDSYERLQTAKELEGVRQEAFPLPPMPRGAFQTIIEGPVQRLQSSKRKLTLDPALTARLLSDIEEGGGKDALPLLAFTLERLYREYGSDGDLRLGEYQQLGGISGSIKAAIENALRASDADPTITKDPDERLVLLRRAMIPALAVVDPDTRTPRRRVARLSEIPSETRGLVNCLVEARLLTTDEVTENGKSQTTIEPAHEALLRQWRELREWLKEDTAALLTLGGVQQAARDWEGHDKSDNWLTHSAGRLEDTERLRERADFARFVTPIEQAYLQACRVSEDEKKYRELEAAKRLAEEQRRVAEEQRKVAEEQGRTAQRTRMGLIAAGALLLVATGAAVFGLSQAVKTEQRSAVLAANLAQSLTQDGALDQSLLLMLDAARVFDDASVPDEIRIALTRAIEKRAKIETRRMFPNMKVFETKDALLLVDPATNDIWTLTDSIDARRLVKGQPEDRPIIQASLVAGGNDYIIVRENFQIERINERGGERRVVDRILDAPNTPGANYSSDDSNLRDCVAKLSPQAKKAVNPDQSPHLDSCRDFGEKFILTYTYSSSGGDFRSDELIRQNGKKVDIREMLEQLTEGNVPKGKTSWTAARDDSERVAVVVNRSVYVIDLEGGGGELVLSYRHPRMVEHARLIGRDQLAVVEAATGRIIVHNLDAAPQIGKLSDTTKSLIGTEEGAEIRRRSNCAGWSYVNSVNTVSMPDGRSIAFEKSDNLSELRVTGPAGEMVIRLGADDACAEISSDWRKLLVSKDDNVKIFDFSKVLATGDLAGTEVASIQIKNVSSAFFADAAGETFSTTDFSNQVLLWRRTKDHAWQSEEVFRADNPIVYAEFDAEQRRLLFEEHVSGAIYQGWLYALPSKQLWFDLGSDYKYLGATFTKSSEIVVAEHGRWTRAFVMPPLSELTALADALLSADCRPPSPKDFKRSPCWPSSFR